MKYLQSTFIVLFLWTGLVSKAREIVLTDQKDQYFIADALDYFYDSTDVLTIDQVHSPSGRELFFPNAFPYLTKENEKSYWIRFTVSNKSNKELQSWYFESWGFDIDEIEFYIPDQANNYYVHKMGYAREFSERKLFHKNFLFLIPLKKGEKATFYVRMKRSHPMHLTFLIRSNEQLIKHMAYEYWYLGFFYGIFAIIILLNVYLFFRVKDKIYLYYIFCISSEVIYCLGRDGMGFQFLWPSLPWLNHITHHNIAQFLLIIFTLLYANKFLQLQKKQPVMYKLSLLGMMLNALMFFFYFIHPIPPFFVFGIDALILCIPLVSGIVALKRGDEYVRYYVVAFSCLFISFVLIMMEERSLLPFMMLNYYMINIGMLLEAVFLSVALIDQIRIYRKAYEMAMQNSIEELKEKEKLKDELNQQLEQKVEERTKDIQTMLKVLESKNSELATLNEKVNSMNSLLDKDNQKLKTDLSEVNRSRVLAKDVNFDDFKKVFPDDDFCYNYLEELKWKEGFECKKCGYKKATPDKEHHIMRCKNCNYKESATSDTLFHKLKFPITKAFYMTYLVMVKDKNMTLEELSTILDLRRETCWSFRKKILLAKEECERRGIDTDENGWESLALISVKN